MAVYKHQRKYRAELWIKGRRIWRESGFETELEARVAEADAKDKLQATNTGFMQLCESRLEELELKRTPKHFKENHKLLNPTTSFTD